MSKRLYVALALCCFLIAGLFTGRAVEGATADTLETGPGQEAIAKAFAEISLPKGDKNLLMLTNAGYGQMDLKTTEAFLDIAREVTGCSTGTRSLLNVHSSINDPLWCALFRKDTGKLVFVKWTEQGFVRQMIDARPEKILIPEGWKAAAAGPIGPHIFSVVSTSLTWAVNPPWPLLLSANFHDHFCPGVNAGYVAAEYYRERMPLRQGEQYVFQTAPALCPADALQVIFNTTAGKSSGYVMRIDPALLARYEKEKVQPMTVVMRVNRKADTCDGAVIGFDWNRAYADTGVKADEISPPGGQANPMFWISRTKMSRELVKLPKEKLLSYIIVLKRFSGNARLADKITGGDPYGIVWNE